MSERERQELGRVFGKLRRAKGLTLRDVERRAHICRGYLALLEAGYFNPPPRAAGCKLAALYGVTPADVMAGSA